MSEWLKLYEVKQPEIEGSSESEDVVRQWPFDGTAIDEADVLDFVKSRLAEMSEPYRRKLLYFSLRWHQGVSIVQFESVPPSIPESFYWYTCITGHTSSTSNDPTGEDTDNTWWRSHGEVSDTERNGNLDWVASEDYVDETDTAEIKRYYDTFRTRYEIKIGEGSVTTNATLLAMITGTGPDGRAPQDIADTEVTLPVTVDTSSGADANTWPGHQAEAILVVASANILLGELVIFDGVAPADVEAKPRDSDSKASWGIALEDIDSGENGYVAVGGFCDALVYSSEATDTDPNGVWYAHASETSAVSMTESPYPIGIGVGGYDDGNATVRIHLGAVARDHDELHTVASHSDTSATGGELDTLTDGSLTALHFHQVPVPIMFGQRNTDTGDGAWDTSGYVDTYPGYRGGPMPTSGSIVGFNGQAYLPSITHDGTLTIKVTYGTGGSATEALIAEIAITTGDTYSYAKFNEKAVAGVHEFAEGDSIAVFAYYEDSLAGSYRQANGFVWVVFDDEWWKA